MKFEGQDKDGPKMFCYHDIVTTFPGFPYRGMGGVPLPPPNPTGQKICLSPHLEKSLPVDYPHQSLISPPSINDYVIPI